MTIESLAGEMTGFWGLICLMLVYFMQGGFAMVETGMTRAKNAGNIIMKNLMDFSLGAIGFVLLGYSLICGDSIGGFVGTPMNLFANFAEIEWYWVFFNMVFCATAATIVSGAMAERTKFSAYCVYSIMISLLIYPIEAHWIWGGGWLAEMGFVDFAGSCAVHMCGGVAALVGAKILGARIGKYTVGKDGKKVANAIPGHSLTLAALGVFILWFCWYGFNGAAATTVADASMILVTTTMAASVGATATMIFTWIKYGKPDVSMSLNGALAGLVGITAGCANVDVVGAIVIGLVCGVMVVLAVEFIDQVLCIDDPVGASSVHGVCGALGTIMVGLFDYNDGLFYGGGADLLIVQTIGVVAVAAWVAVTMGIVFMIVKNTMGLRATAEEEIAGLDEYEHGLVSAYADFAPVPTVLTGKGKEAAPVPVDVAIPVTKASSTEATLRKLSIICRHSQLEKLQSAMQEIGVTGMTVQSVMGCGAQKGAAEYYRGTAVDMTLLPKMKVEMVVSAIPVDVVIEAAKKAMYTGHIGDGKIFVYDVLDVVRVRTGESGYDALQDAN